MGFTCGGNSVIALMVGTLSAAAVGLFAHAIGYDRDGAFYPTVLTVVGLLYVLFSVMAGGHGLLVEVACFAIFAALAAVGFKFGQWLVAVGLALHGLFDLARHSFLVAPGAPAWWPAFCGAYAVVAAIGLAALLFARRQPLEQTTR
jgi:hypothetical protein